LNPPPVRIFTVQQALIATTTSPLGYRMSFVLSFGIDPCGVIIAGNSGPDLASVRVLGPESFSCPWVKAEKDFELLGKSNLNDADIASGRSEQC
jgi:hypothetical protein